MHKNKKQYKVYNSYDEWIAEWDTIIYKFVYREVKNDELAKDLKQDIATYFIDKKGLERYNPKLSSFSTYMIFCIKNRLVNFYRDSYKYPLNNVIISLDDNGILKIAKAQGLLKICYKDTLERVFSALERLDRIRMKSYRDKKRFYPFTKIFNLLYVNALPRKEVMRQMHCSYTIISKAIKRIRLLPEVQDLLDIAFSYDWS